jgi:hypothetical protein
MPNLLASNAGLLRNIGYTGTVTERWFLDWLKNHGAKGIILISTSSGTVFVIYSDMARALPGQKKNITAIFELFFLPSVLPDTSKIAPSFSGMQFQQITTVFVRLTTPGAPFLFLAVSVCFLWLPQRLARGFPCPHALNRPNMYTYIRIWRWF